MACLSSMWELVKEKGSHETKQHEGQVEVVNRKVRRWPQLRYKRDGARKESLLVEHTHTRRPDDAGPGPGSKYDLF